MSKFKSFLFGFVQGVWDTFKPVVYLISVSIVIGFGFAIGVIQAFEYYL